MRKRIQVPVSTYSLNMETYAETSTRNKRLCSPQRRGRKDHLCKNIERTSGGLELASPFRAFSSISGGWRGQLALSGGFPRKFMSGSSAAAPRLTSPIYNFSLHPCALSNAHKYADELCSQTEPAKFPNCVLSKNTACPLDFRLDRNDADNKIPPDVCVYIYPLIFLHDFPLELLSGESLSAIPASASRFPCAISGAGLRGRVEHCSEFLSDSWIQSARPCSTFPRL